MKVYPYYIHKTSDQNLIVQVDKGKTKFDKLHLHDEIQISFIKSGEGKLVVMDTIKHFTQGDIFVLGSRIPHLINDDKNQPFEMITLFLSKNTLGNGFFSIPELTDTKHFFQASQVGFVVLDRLIELQAIFVKLINSVKIEKVRLFLQLIELLVISNKEIISKLPFYKEPSLINGRRMQILFNYTLTHFQNDIKIYQVAELVHMTPHSFCRFFKKQTNKTYVQFLNEFRIEHACQLLKDKKQKSIAQIASDCGFASLSNFNRRFKNLKSTTPKAYRTNML